MKIVVLDGYTLNPGDLEWSSLAELGQLSVHDRTPAELLLSRAAGAQVLVTNKVVLGREQIAALPALRYIGVLATGVNVIDLDAAVERGIVVTNVPAYSTPSVAQHVFALLLELTRGVGRHSELVRAGAWSKSPDFTFWASPQIELAGKTMGLIGFGLIGQAVARIAMAFEMRVLVHTRTPTASRDADAEFVAIESLLKNADVVSLHCPLNQTTERLINAERLAMMSPSAWLINTGRGALIDEAALAEALREGRLAGAGLDVLETEPPAADNPLLAAPNCVITPHLAWATHSARRRLMAVATENLQAFLAGTPKNRVA